MSLLKSGPLTHDASGAGFCYTNFQLKADKIRLKSLDKWVLIRIFIYLFIEKKYYSRLFHIGGLISIIKVPFVQNVTKSCAVQKQTIYRTI
jgi:hypothetical protein